MNFIVSRILQGFFSLFGVASLVFFMFSVLPGDPAEMMLDKNQTSEQIEILKIFNVIKYQCMKVKNNVIFQSILSVLKITRIYKLVRFMCHKA